MADTKKTKAKPKKAAKKAPSSAKKKPAAKPAKKAAVKSTKASPKTATKKPVVKKAVPKKTAAKKPAPKPAVQPEAKPAPKMEPPKATPQQKTKPRPTPEQLRHPFMRAMLRHANFDGWSMIAFKKAATDLRISTRLAELSFPGGPIEVLEAHLADADANMVKALAALGLGEMKIRDRITTAIRTRITQAIPYREAVQRGMATLARPHYTATGLRSLTKTVDLMWRAAGDTATDYNWYTKRMTLAGVYMATLNYWFADESKDFEDTWAFLDRRIEDVMKIETAKYKMRQAAEKIPSPRGFFDRLRGKH